MCLFLPHHFSDFQNQSNHKHTRAFLSSLFLSASEWTEILHIQQSLSAYSGNWHLFPSGARWYWSLSQHESGPRQEYTQGGSPVHPSTPSIQSTHRHSIFTQVPQAFPGSLMCMCSTVGGNWRTCGKHANPTKTLSEPTVIPRAPLQQKSWRNWIGKDGGPEVAAAFYQMLSLSALHRRLQQNPFCKSCCWRRHQIMF